MLGMKGKKSAKEKIQERKRTSGRLAKTKVKDKPDGQNKLNRVNF